MSRALPSSTRACTSGCFVFSWRSVVARSRSTIWRFSSSLVGSASPRRRPLASRYVTRGPSTKISSTSRRARRSVNGPKSVTERSTRLTIVAGSPSGNSSPARARRWKSSTARSTSTRTSASSRSGCSRRRSMPASASRRISSYASVRAVTMPAPAPRSRRRPRRERPMRPQPRQQPHRVAPLRA